MNIENLLKYQKLDQELFAVEQKIANSPYRKKANELATLAKKTQAKSVELETEAEKLLAQIEDLKEKYATNKAQADKMMSGKIENMTVEELDKLSTLQKAISKNLSVLEKMLQKSAENINHILAEFNKTKKLYDQARTQYVTCKQKLDEQTKASEPEKAKIKKQLEVLEKDVDPQIMADYKKKRNDNIFPVIVPLENGNFCGRCRMELPKVAISRLKEKGIITCEHCKRYIYLKQE